MCGFFLVISKDQDPIDSATNLDSTIKSRLSLRGNDRFTTQNLSLNSNFKGIFFHSLLSIYGWDLEADQSKETKPRSLEYDTDNSETLSYNGEIYSIRKKHSRVQDFLSDEFFLLDYLRSLDLNSTKDIAKLQLDVDGQYSFVYTKSGNILLARDYHGHKPFFYFYSRDLLIASSSLSLLRLFLNSLDLCGNLNNDKPLAAYYHLPYCDELACSLGPGSSLLFDINSDKIVLRYSLSAHTYQHLCAPASQITKESLASSFRLSVASLIPRARPYCLLLSGGFDSALLLSTVCEIGQPPYVALTYDNGKNSPDVLSAVKLASHFNIRHIILGSTMEEHQNWLDACSSYELPGDPANEAIYHLLREASRYSRIVLCGDGGDEISRRYRRFIYYKQPIRAIKIAYNILQDSGKRDLINLTRDFLFHSLNTDDLVNQKLADLSILHQIAHKSADPIDMYKISDHLLNASYDLPMIYELLLNLPERLLSKTDQISYSVGVEVRSPFLSSTFSSQLLAANSRKQRVNASKLLLDKKLSKLISTRKFGLA